MDVIWADFRHATERIVNECVANGNIGWFDGYTRGTIEARTRLQVSGRNSEFTQQATNRQIQLARDRTVQVPRGTLLTELNDTEDVGAVKFAVGYYEV